MTLRIIHVASGREWRGGQKQAWLLARELQRLNVNQIVVTGRGTELAQHLTEDGVAVHAVEWRAGLSPAAARAAWSVAADGGILHAHDGHATTLAGMAAAMRRLPFITTRRLVSPLSRRGFSHRADRVVAISSAVRDVLVRDGIDGKKVPVIHSGVDLDALALVRPDGAREALGIPADRPLAVAVGQLETSKDHRTLIAAAAQTKRSCPELMWVIAGRGPLLKTLEAQIAKLELTDTVRLAGQLSDPLPLIATADLFVTSSREEGLGTAMLDAMALGRPVAATGGGGIPEILAGETGLVVPVGNAAALADVVVRIIQTPALRATLTERGLNRVADFSARRMAEAYLSLYRSIDSDLVKQ